MYDEVVINIGVLAAFWTGIICWVICLIYTIFGRWYASFAGWILFGVPFLFGSTTTYVALRRLDWIPPGPASWVSLVIFGTAALIMTAFLILVVKEAKVVPVFRNFLETMASKR